MESGWWREGCRTANRGLQNKPMRPVRVCSGTGDVGRTIAAGSSVETESIDMAMEGGNEVPKRLYRYRHFDERTLESLVNDMLDSKPGQAARRGSATTRTLATGDASDRRFLMGRVDGRYTLCFEASTRTELESELKPFPGEFQRWATA